MHQIFSRSSSSEKIDDHAEGAMDADDDDEGPWRCCLQRVLLAGVYYSLFSWMLAPARKPPSEATLQAMAAPKRQPRRAADTRGKAAGASEQVPNKSKQTPETTRSSMINSITETHTL